MRKPDQVAPRQLRIRLIKSIVLGTFFALAGVISFWHIEMGPQDGEALRILRRAFHFNEAIWTRLQSATRLSVGRPAPPLGKEPRFNGDLGLQSDVDVAHYAIRVDNGDKKLSIPLSAIRSLPQTTYSTDFRCIEGWTDVTQFTGTKFSVLMERYGLGRKADGTLYRYVGLETPDRGYYVSIDMKSMLHPQTLLAYEENGRPLDSDNGAPVRLVIPIKYGIKSLKRIGRIFFADERPPDYWAERGYDWYSGL